MANREAKELIRTTHGHELRAGGTLEGGEVQGREGKRGGKKWENCTSIINKIRF